VSNNKLPLSARIVSAQRFLARILDSFWAFLTSLFSKKSAPLLALEILGGIATILTLAGFYLSYLAPKLSVDVTGSLQPRSPLAGVFHLSNEGTLPIHDVVVTCGNLNATLPNIQVWGPGERVAPESVAPILSPGHKLTLACGHTYGFTGVTNFTSAEMVITIHYRPGFHPMAPKRDVSLESRKDTDWRLDLEQRSTMNKNCHLT